LIAEIPAEEWRDRPVVSRRGGVLVKLAKRPHPRKTQKQENAKNRFQWHEPGTENLAMNWT